MEAIVVGIGLAGLVNQLFSLAVAVDFQMDHVGLMEHAGAGRSLLRHG